MIDARKNRFGIIENLGWPDRGIRIMIGTVLVAVPLTIIAIQGPINHGASASAWLYVAMLAALYPFWTTAIGWDPLYQLFKVRSCGGSEKNPCGTLPYELDAAAGRHPIPDSDVIHSLGAAHHSGERNRERRRETVRQGDMEKETRRRTAAN
jgi:hypothetical protein